MRSVAALPLRAAAVAAMALGLLPARPGVGDRPNIVLFYADDLGWADLGAYGNGYHLTPRIDRLMADGLRCTQAYAAAPLCAPSRIGLLSGRHPARFGCYEVTQGRFLTQVNLEEVRFYPPENRIALPSDRPILPERLREAGYRTGVFGKWHVGPFRPRPRGFDDAVLLGIRSHVDVRQAAQFVDPSYPPPAGPSGDYLAECAVRFMERGGPCFLYVPFTLIHTVSGGGGQPLRLDPEPELLAAFKARPPTDLHRNPGYAAMVAASDRAVGRMLDAIESRGLSRTTLVIFASDNGGLLGARRVTAGGVEAGEFTSNHPLRGGTAQLFEGGIRIPMSMTWPGRIRGDAVCEAAVSPLDIAPTLLELAGAAAETELAEFDGRSLAPLLANPGAAWPDRELVWHYPGYRFRGVGPLEGPDAPGTQRPESAIRRGRWKLIESLEDGRVQLYDLGRDIGETTDVSAEHPEVVRELRARLAAWRRETGAPMPEPMGPP